MTALHWLGISILIIVGNANANESAAPSRPSVPPATSASVPSAAESADPNFQPRATTGLEAQGARAADAPAATPRREVDPEKLERQAERLVAKIAKSKCPKGSADGDVDSSEIIAKYERKYPDLMNDRDLASEIEAAIEERVEVCIASGGKTPQSQEQAQAEQQQKMQQMQLQMQMMQSMQSSTFNPTNPLAGFTPLTMNGVFGDKLPSTKYSSSLTSSFYSPFTNNYMNSMYAPSW